MKRAAPVEAALDERARLGTRGVAAGRTIADGDHWSVQDVVCSCTWFAALAADAGVRRPTAPFDLPRIPLVRSLAPMVARARTALASGATGGWGELAFDAALGVVRLIAGGLPAVRPTAAVHERRVTELVRLIDEHPANAYSLGSLAQAAGLSPFHFTRTFQGVTGFSPHQYVMRTRLQHAAGHPGRSVSQGGRRRARFRLR